MKLRGISGDELANRLFQSFVSRIFYGVFHGRHDRVGGAGGAKDVNRLFELARESGRPRRNDRPLRQRGQALMYPVHPKIRISARIVFLIVMQMSSVRAVDE